MTFQYFSSLGFGWEDERANERFGMGFWMDLGWDLGWIWDVLGRLGRLKVVSGREGTRREGKGRERPGKGGERMESG